MCFTWCLRKNVGKGNRKGLGKKHSEAPDGSMRPSKRKSDVIKTEESTEANSSRSGKRGKDGSKRKSKAGRKRSKENREGDGAADTKSTSSDKSDVKRKQEKAELNDGGQKDDTKKGELMQNDKVPNGETKDAQEPVVEETKETDQVDGAKQKNNLPRPGRAQIKVHVKERTKDDYCFLDEYCKTQIRRSMEQRRQSVGNKPISRAPSCKAFR